MAVQLLFLVSFSFRNVTFHDFTYVNFDENPETIDQQNFKTLPSSIPSGSGKIIFQNDEEDFLNLLEKSFATFEEDLLSGCVEESDIEKLLQVERDVSLLVCFCLFVRKKKFIMY